MDSIAKPTACVDVHYSRSKSERCTVRRNVELRKIAAVQMQLDTRAPRIRLAGLEQQVTPAKRAGRTPYEAPLLGHTFLNGRTAPHNHDANIALVSYLRRNDDMEKLAVLVGANGSRHHIIR